LISSLIFGLFAGTVTSVKQFLDYMMTGFVDAVYPLHTFVPFDMIKYNFMAIIAVVSILLLTLTGFDRFIPLFGLPSESNMRLKKTPKTEI